MDDNVDTQRHSFRGVTQAHKEHAKWLKYTWITCIVALFATLLMLEFHLFISYYDYPINTQIKNTAGLGNHCLYNFALCNSNPVSGKGLSAWKEYKANVQNNLNTRN